jgi:hypothetical protein
MSNSTFSHSSFTAYVAIIILLSSILGSWQHVNGAEVFQISGYYLGATPEELGVTVESDLTLEKKFYEAEANGVRLFFVRVQDRLRVYRIVKEEATNQNSVRPILDNLKAKYGMPDKQQIKTSSVRPSNERRYKTTVKNRALWNISESQEFIAEVESSRVVFELIDHNPEKVKIIKKPDSMGDGEFTVEGWDPDY